MSLTRTTLVVGLTLLATPAGLAEDIGHGRPVIGQPVAPPFGDVEHFRSSSLGGRKPEEQIIQHQLDSTESRVLRHSQRPLENEQVQRDLGATGQRLDSFKTMHPNARATPLFERHLDRLERPARIREPGPPTLLDQAPTLLEQR